MPGPMMNPGSDTSVSRMALVLAALSSHARRWELFTQADFSGADHHTRVELDRLPDRTHPSLETVLTLLH